ncbi:MAG TPA: GNAT family N-acetyltransferase [Candidatus Didemnitutus sp.]|nr:GNAT family N-acetyltransferase [Candidatus Didemnitutus sp.]
MTASANSISIRRCAPGDEALLALIGQATFLETFAGILPGTDILAHCQNQHAASKYAAWLNDPASAAWLAEMESGGAPVGYLVLTKPDLPLADINADDLEVKRVYLLRRCQGSGVGARLMNEARDLARPRGVRRLLLGVYGKNDAAIGFYEKLGYRCVGTREFRVGHGTYHDLILALDLSASL